MTINNYTHIQFEVTEECNCCCTYCYLNKRNSKNNLSEETVDIFFSKYSENLSKVNKQLFEYSFWGGEPFLNFTMVKYIVSKCESLEEYFEKTRGIIVTNGIIMNEVIAHFCKEHNIIIQITIDGNEKLHNSYRILRSGGGTYGIILKNIEILKRVGVKYHIRSTVTSELNSFSYLEKIQCNKFFFGIVSNTNTFNDKQLTQEIAESSAKRIVSEFRNQLSNKYTNYTAECLNISAMIDILRNGTSCESCYAGCKTLTISVDGDYYPCHRFVNNSKYKIGSVCSGLDVDKLELYKQNIVDNKVKCKTCSVRKFCGGTCIYEVLSNDGDLRSYINIVECAFRKTLYLEVIKILLLNNNNTENEVSKLLSKGRLKIKNSIFTKSKDTNKIDFINNGIIYKNVSLWYSGNITSMAIWELIDGKRKAIEIAKEIADACEVKPNDIQEEIYQQLRSFQELGFIEEVQKESVVLN